MEVLFSEKAKLPTTFGDFNIVSFKKRDGVEEHCIMYQGDLESADDVLVRIHSECLTGDVFTSLKCDCGEQLQESMRMIAERGKGVIIYLRQEGRGIGLFNKINAYALQDQGQDTIEANHSLGFATDLRDFSIAHSVLEYLKVNSIVLLSNNPEKIEVLQNSGIHVSGVMPLHILPNQHNLGYLKTKKEALNHLLQV